MYLFRYYYTNFYPEDWPVEEGDTLTLDIFGESYDDITAILLEMEEFTVGALGRASQNDVDIVLQIDIDATVQVATLFD